MYKGIQTFGKVVEHRAEAKPNSRFVRFQNVDLTYGQFHRDGNKMAHVLEVLNLSKGQTCAVMLPNSPEFLAVWLGLARLGVIEVPINVAYRGDLLAYILNQAECQAMVTSSKWVDKVRDIMGELIHLRHLIVVGDNYVPLPGQIMCHSYHKLLANASDELWIDRSRLIYGQLG